MPQYKLIYFEPHGMGELIRMQFFLKGVEYEDCIVNRQKEWPDMKKNNKELFPLGQLPVLIIDGKPMPHSKAINRYLARNFGLYGKTDEQTNIIELVSETVDDITRKLFPIYYDEDSENKAKSVQKFKETISVPKFQYFVKLITQIEGPYFCGNEITLGDILAFTIFDAIILAMKLTDILDPYPELATFYKKIYEDSPLTPFLKAAPRYVPSTPGEIIECII